MKQLLGLVGVCAFLMLGTSSVSAQQKIAHINQDTIIMRMDEYNKALASVQAYATQLQKLLKAEEDQLIAYAQLVQQQEKDGAITQKDLVAAQQKINNMRSALQQNARKADTDLQAREAKELTPVYQKFRSAMTAVAKKEGYAYIVNRNFFMYSDGGIDATQAVANYLKVDLSKEVVNPTPTNGGGANPNSNANSNNPNSNQ
jgi:outer membrane protein